MVRCCIVRHSRRDAAGKMTTVQHKRYPAGGVGTELVFSWSIVLSQRGSSLAAVVARRDVKTLLEAAGKIGHVFETDCPGYF